MVCVPYHQNPKSDTIYRRCLFIGMRNAIYMVLWEPNNILLDFYNGDLFRLRVDLYKCVFVKVSRKTGDVEKFAGEIKEMQIFKYKSDIPN
jgi:hypothetical protein